MNNCVLGNKRIRIKCALVALLRICKTDGCVAFVIESQMIEMKKMEK